MMRGTTDIRAPLHGVEYDFVCSLGQDCACACYLQNHGLRQSSYPFDWLAGWDFGPEACAELIADDFRGFLALENLERLQNPRGKWDDATHDYYYDRRSGFRFLHDFPMGMTVEESFPSVRQKYDRRIERLYRSVCAAKCVLFVYWTRKRKLAASEIEAAVMKLRARFPGRRIDLLAIEHADCPRPEVRRISAGVTWALGRFYDSDEHPCWGNSALNNRLFALIRMRYPLWPRRVLRRILTRLATMWHFSHADRRMAREQWDLRHPDWLIVPRQTCPEFCRFKMSDRADRRGSVMSFESSSR